MTIKQPKPLSERLSGLLIHRDEYGYADSIDIWDTVFLHLNVGTCRNEENVDALIQLLREASELARRVEGAPKVKVRGKIGEVCTVPVSHDYCGKRVALVEVGE
jgi:hypothetical protein